ncbi:MAG: nickel pincer cofactor biosynthesis protein LarC [Deltaproteobacteria bacterium]|nr:MAG: nickel pincer cofactor biosynthesis protein LarC [Deltaproteobacteria bacterium]
MTVLALEPIGGVAGDMLVAALLHLGAPRSALDDGLAALAKEDPDLRSLRIVAAPAEVNGIAALHVTVEVPDAVREREPHHRPYRRIRELLARAVLPPRAKAFAQAAFQSLAEAEGRIHGVAPDEVELHEVGALDSIADVVGASLLVAALDPGRIVALPPPAGSGTVRSRHGPIPVPAPAVLEVLRGRALRASGPGERTTPTGAALLAAMSEPVESLPSMTVQRAGYGAGTRRWDDAPNLLRAVIGEETAHGREALLVLEANLDDLSPQFVAAALEAALAAGALDAWIGPVTMKKGRPGHVFGALVTDGTGGAVEGAIFRETSTLGIRATRAERTALARESVEVTTEYGRVRVKVGRMDGAIVNVAPEFEDCKARAGERGVAVREVAAAAMAAFRATNLR